MKIPRASRLVAAALMLALVPAAVLSDRALRRARAAALERAQDGRVEESARAGLELRALIAAIEADAAEGRARDGVEAWRFAAPLESRLSTRRLPLDVRSRGALVVAASTSDVSPQGLPVAAVAAVLLGDPRVSAGVAERLLDGALPVHPPDLPALAALLGAADDARILPLRERLESIPPVNSIPRVPEFRRIVRDGCLLGWSRSGDDIIHWSCALAPVGARVADAGEPGAVPVPGVERLALVAPLDDMEARRAGHMRFVSALAFGIVGAFALGAAGLMARDERRLRREREFLSSVTHELRTPVTALRLLGETLAGGRGEPVAYGALIAEESSRIEALVERSLLAARMDSPRLERVSIAEMLARAMRLAEPLARRKGKRLELDAPSELPQAAWDGEAVRQALSNLVDNALRHGGESVIVRARAADDHVRIEVRDDGPGIVRKDRRRIFGRFERGRSASGGTGLGLWLVENVARAHGGRVELVTEDGCGCTFSLLLPLAPRAPA